MPSKFEINHVRVRTALANLDVLQRTDIRDLDSLLRNVSSKYGGVPVVANYKQATTDDCARSAAKNIEELVADRHFIRGLGAVDAAAIDVNLIELADRCRKFALQQQAPRWSARLATAIDSLLRSELVQPGWAGSARH